MLCEFCRWKAKVRFNPDSTNLEKIKKAIESLGYKVKDAKGEMNEGHEEGLISLHGIC